MICLQVIVVPTQAAKHFIPIEEIKQIEGADVFLDEEEWASWQHLKDPVLHIEAHPKGLHSYA